MVRTGSTAAVVLGGFAFAVAVAVAGFQFLRHESNAHAARPELFQVCGLDDACLARAEPFVDGCLAANTRYESRPHPRKPSAVVTSPVVDDAKVVACLRSRLGLPPRPAGPPVPPAR